MGSRIFITDLDRALCAYWHNGANKEFFDEFKSSERKHDFENLEERDLTLMSSDISKVVRDCKRSITLRGLVRLDDVKKEVRSFVKNLDKIPLSFTQLTFVNSYDLYKIDEYLDAKKYAKLQTKYLKVNKRHNIQEKVVNYIMNELWSLHNNVDYFKDKNTGEFVYIYYGYTVHARNINNPKREGVKENMLYIGDVQNIELLREFSIRFKDGDRVLYEE